MGHITPHLVVRDVEVAVGFYRRALGAVEVYRAATPEGNELRILRIENSFVIVGEEDADLRRNNMSYAKIASPDTLGGTTAVFQLNVDDVDEVYKRAVDSGATPTLPPLDQFWGDRYGLITDPFGHMWALATIQEELSAEEIEERMMGRLPKTLSEL
jgi:PhnB protein